MTCPNCHDIPVMRNQCECQFIVVDDPVCKIAGGMEYDGEQKDVEMCVERHGKTITGVTFDASKFEVRTQGGRIVVERKAEGQGDA